MAVRCSTWSYLGRHVNGKFANTLGLVYLVIIIVVAAAAIPLMIITGAGTSSQELRRD